MMDDGFTYILGVLATIVEDEEYFDLLRRIR
jgi:hypothetical protein